MSEGKHRRDLVEPEGVNSGSTSDLLRGAEQDARPGGDASGSEQAESTSACVNVVRPPWDSHDAGAPSLQQSREEGAR
ncbi:MAG TPA: hypothetical protein VGJ14_03610 [Sporichthyaceae bacterium]|jgi:hypothetical protein